MKVSMCKTMRTYEWKNLSKDLLAGLVIMAVSIPISMGYAQREETLPVPARAAVVVVHLRSRAADAPDQ